MPCLVAQLDGRLPDIQMVSGSIWQHFFVQIGHEIISTAILPSGDSSRAVVSYWQKDVHYVLVNCLGLSLARKSVDRLIDHLNMTIVVDST